MAIKIGKLFGTDKLVGTDDDDLLIALGAKTTLDGGAGNDIMFGGSANDIFIGGKGSDYMNGGAGMDTVDYSASGGPVTVNLATGKGSGGDAQGDTMISIEKVIGSAYDDTFIGSKGNDSFTGGAGADKFVMSAGDDTITDFTPGTPETMPGPDVLIDFNDRSNFVSTIPNGYGGLNWGNTATVADGSAVGAGTPFAYAYSGGGATITAAGADFTLKSAYMASISGDLQVTVRGWDDGALKVSQSFPIGSLRTLVNFVGFDSIDKVTISGPPSPDFDDITLAFEVGNGNSTGGDKIDVPDGTNVAALVASAVTDGLGGSLLIHSTGTIHLVGVQPQDVKADWFV